MVIVIFGAGHRPRARPTGSGRGRTLPVKYAVIQSPRLPARQRSGTVVVSLVQLVLAATVGGKGRPGRRLCNRG